MVLTAQDVFMQAQKQAIYCLYLYLIHKIPPLLGEPLALALLRLEWAAERAPSSWSAADITRLRVFKAALHHQKSLAVSKIRDVAASKSGLTACSFVDPAGVVSVAFRGTGDGEWIDNGEGLSGVAEENTYLTYGKDGEIAEQNRVPFDYATDQQVQALNWFYKIVSKNAWDKHTPIIVSGHSKGGNKAQFISIHTDLVSRCYSFNGQGFSPEALSAFKLRFPSSFSERAQRIFSFCAENDYVNVLGLSLVPKEQVFYLRSFPGLHPLEALLDEQAVLRPQGAQGELSRYIQNVSKDLMSLPPFLRKYATLGIMNIFQKFLGKGPPVNGDAVSLKQTITGISLALGPLLQNLTSLEPY